MPTNVLVTGGAGYIGAVLVPLLLRNGYAVHVLDNFRYNQTSLADCCLDPNFRITRGDCREQSELQHALREADIVIPLAAIVGAPACDHDPTAARSTNLDAIRLLLSIRSRDQRIIFPNTNSGYGLGDGESYCTEETPLRPISLYGRTKVEAEQAVLESGTALTFRLATVFGLSPRMRFDLLVNDFVSRAVTDRALVVFEGHAKRNFIHVRDVAGAFLHAIENFETMQGMAYNVGLSNANLSKRELCAEIQKQVPGFTYIEAAVGEDPDKRDYIVSNTRIEATGFRPLVSLRDGISELIKGCAIFRITRLGNV